MNNRYLNALEQARKSTQPYLSLIAGSLGIILNGVQTVEVPTRASYVYVQLRSSQAEVIQAFNDQVSPAYGLPVFVTWQGNRYVIVGRDTLRYSDWQNYSSYLPRHANTHEMNLAAGGGGDVVFVYQQQMLPVLVIPSGSLGAPGVVVNDYMFMTTSGTFGYSPVQGSRDLTVWNPVTGNIAWMVLISLDMKTNSLRYDVGSGSSFSAVVTGQAGVAPFIPGDVDITRYLPLGAIRLVTGTAIIGWDNIYDVRQIFGIGLAGGQGAAGVAGSAGAFGVVGMDEGILLGTGTYLNFVGAGVTATISGAIINVNIPGGGGGSTGSNDATYLRLDATNDPVFGLLHLQKQGGYTAGVGVLTIGQSGTTENGVFHRMWGAGNVAGYRILNNTSDASYDYYALNHYVDNIGYYVEQLISGTTPSHDASQPSFSSFRLNEVNGTALWKEAAFYAQAPATKDAGGALHLQDQLFVDRLWLNPGVVKAATPEAHLFDTYENVPTGSSVNLVTIKNHGTSKFAINENGDINNGPTITFATGDGRTVTVKGGIITSVA